MLGERNAPLASVAYYLARSYRTSFRILLKEKYKSAVANRQFTNNPILISFNTSVFGSVSGMEKYGISIALHPATQSNKQKMIKIKLLS